MKSYAKKWYQKRGRVANRNSWLRSAYGIDLFDYNLMVEMQGGRCLICQKTFEHQLVVDHDHQTKEVRGLLCSQCNQGLGFFHDDATSLERARLYITDRLSLK
jgi:hypothetical protein